MDKSPKSLSENECFFLLNNERYLNGEKGKLGKTTPLAANYPACDVSRPAGENYRVGSFYSALTNETYSWIYNSNGVNYIQRINGDGKCEIVYYGNPECFPLSAEPEHAIEQWRAWLDIDESCEYVDKKLTWVNGKNDIGHLDVEASIATNSFTTPFFDRCADPCSMIRLCVPDPCGCPQGEFIPLSDDELALTNHLVDVGIKLAYRPVYYDGRPGLWSNPSTLFYQDSKGCFDNSIGFSRCLKFRIPVGNPMVDKIEIAFSKGELSESGGTIWYLAEVVDKYKKYNSTQVNWYERELAELRNYSDEDCSFDYIFCNDKQCDVIDITDFNRVINPTPREPQGLIPINGAIGFYNYKTGNCAIDDEQIAKMKVSVKCEDNVECEPEFATVTVRALIHNVIHNRNQFIYREGGSADNSPDDPTDTAWFGGLTSSGYVTGYDQFFNDETRNFIAYAEGTEYWGEMKQWKSHAYFNNREIWGVVARMAEGSTRDRWRRAARNGEFFYQELKLKVLKGTKGFLRLSSHHSTSNNQDTSTFVVGTLNDIRQYGGDININALSDFTKEEIYFDTCDGDVELFESFVVVDNFANSTPNSSAYHGYIKDANNLPVEGAVIVRASDTGNVLATTDHNGFYHFFLPQGTNDSVEFQIRVELDCVSSFGLVQPLIIQGEIGSNTRLDATITNEVYKADFYANVHVPVVDCDGNPVSGIRVALSGSKYKVTDGDGIARFKVRNYIGRNRTFRAIVLNQSGCFSMDCLGECNACMPTTTHTGYACYLGKPTIAMTGLQINVNAAITGTRGLKLGGRYPFGFVVKYPCGKITAVNEVKYVDIPKAQEKQQQSFCSFEYDATGMSLPGAECIEIVRGINVNPFELQWSVDKIERNDDGNIVLTIQSLNDYNEKYFFKTNTIYSWLKNDRVEFIKNGDGKIFSITQHGLLNYLTLSPFNSEQESGVEDSPADFFNQLIIKDDGRLDSLTEGAIIEIQRSKECITEPVYFTICATIPVDEDGNILYPTGVFDTFDTFFVNRKIGKFPTQQFEHHSPSDFWGTRLSDTGKPHFTNEYEAEARYGRNITLNTPNEFNRFGDFVKTFDSPEHGDLIAISLNDGKIGMAISEHDNSLFEVGNDLLKVGNDGVVRAKPADELISDTQPKLSGKYGCQYPHIGSIYFGDGWATWWDVNKHTYVKHDYQLAKPADEGRAQTYFRRKSQEIETYNRTQTNPLNKIRFCTGYNMHTGALMITNKALRDSAIYNHKKPFMQRHDTIMYHPISEDFLGQASFVPEGYATLNLFDGAGCAFMVFFNGIPYIHPIIPTKWNEFFGVAVDRVVGIAINKFPDKSKRPLAIEIQDETMWFVSEVSTEKSNFRSEIPPIRFKKTLNKWNAAFLFNINGRGGLYGDNKAVAGESASGEYIKVTLVRDNTDGLKYNTIDNSKRVAYDELDMIMFKMSVNEQTGFSGNV